MSKKPLIILTGPTAVGKTALSIDLAKSINGEIISADSMQVYRKMNIGTAKITPEEMQGVKHYLIDVLDPFEAFNVFLFRKMALEAMDGIYAAGHIPIIVGGTGFYIQSVLYDVDFTEDEVDSEYRNSLYKIAKDKGAEALHKMLRAVDEKYAASVHANNVKRVARALEYYHQTGEKLSEHNEEMHEHESPYNFEYFVLTDDRATIYERIDKRVDIMIKDGLLDEVKALMDEGYDESLVSMQGLGYKELIRYYRGEISLDEAVYIIKRDTRHFAKRQLTWFKREKVTDFLDVSVIPRDSLLDVMMGMLKEKGII